MNLYTLELAATDPCEIFSHVAALPYSLFLDSADRNHQDARYSFIVAQPIETIESKNGKVTVTNAAQQTSFAGDPFEILKQRLKAWKFAEKPLPVLPPFQGGAAGLFGYDLVRGIENLPAYAADNPNIPDMAVGIYDQVITFDHKDNKAWIITHAADEAEAERKRRFVLSVVLSAPSPQPSPQWGEGVRWAPNFTTDAYKTQVAKIIEYIRAGDIFQANLSQRFDAALPKNFDSFAHYLHLRDVNPAPFAAYMNLGNVKIASASPERFLNVNEKNVQAKPIKGTIRRLAQNDEAQKKALQSSDKDRAENIMIVDLLRNDLSKVCEAPSVTVEKLCGIESFAKVHHLVSEITGTLKKYKSSLDLLQACFPGGSITGAPKIRAMEIIEELELTRRGPYCGSIGYIGFNNCMDMNILIRTLVYDGPHASFQSGGGITADSSPEEEYQETLDKAEGIFNSFEAPVASSETRISHLATRGSRP